MSRCRHQVGLEPFVYAKVGQVDVQILSTSVPLRVDSHKRLTLHLEGGRKLDFYWLHGNATATEGLY